MHSQLLPTSPTSHTQKPGHDIIRQLHCSFDEKQYTIVALCKDIETLRDTIHKQQNAIEKLRDTINKLQKTNAGHIRDMEYSLREFSNQLHEKEACNVELHKRLELGDNGATGAPSKTGSTDRGHDMFYAHLIRAITSDEVNQAVDPALENTPDGLARD